ncbi:HNH endonuclease [Glutamicibacter nicotianae]|uniref:HNH endonuclease n=1 Tax=Glutamicibacter nicotianae TaxID=37929 RepID=UPI00167FA5A8|nr:HNH endonuclease [Glutamicibacter nicotianae]
MRLLRRTLAFFTLVSTLVLSSCSSLDSAEFPPLPDAQGAPAPSTAVQREIYAESLELLDEIAVKGRAPKTGYDRAKFGKGWKDPDRNGCDARNDILSRDLVDVTYKSAARPCVVLRGRFDDPYTGKTIEFKRGQGTSTAVQIDHVLSASHSELKDIIAGQNVSGINSTRNALGVRA